MLDRPVLPWLTLNEVSDIGYTARNLLKFPQLKQMSLGMTVEQDVHSTLGSKGATMWVIGEFRSSAYIVV